MPSRHHRIALALLGSAAALLLAPLIGGADTAVPPPPPPAAQSAPPPAPVQSAPAPLSVADATAIQATLQGAPAQGIAAPNLSADVAQLAGSDASGQALAQAKLARAAIAYARAEHGMSLDPASLDDNFALRAPFDAAGEFAAARASGKVGAWLEAQTRRDPAYLALVDARARYEDIDGHGGWGTIDAGKPVRAGQRDRRAPALRQRLAAEGYDAPAPADPKAANVFDAALAKALAEFQDHHGLKADGVLTAPTLAALNVSAHDRLVALDVNLERARWLPIAMPTTRIEADVAGPDVALFQDGQSALAMRAIAGEVKRPTPIFASRGHRRGVQPAVDRAERHRAQGTLPEGPRLSRPQRLPRGGWQARSARRSEIVARLREVSDPRPLPGLHARHAGPQPLRARQALAQPRLRAAGEPARPRRHPARLGRRAGSTRRSPPEPPGPTR